MHGGIKVAKLSFDNTSQISSVIQIVEADHIPPPESHYPWISCWTRSEDGGQKDPFLLQEVGSRKP